MSKVKKFVATIEYEVEATVDYKPSLRVERHELTPEAFQEEGPLASSCRTVKKVKIRVAA